MEIKSKILVIIYVIVALITLVMTWYHIPAYSGKGLVEAIWMFWEDALFKTSPSGKFIIVDILFLAFVCNIFMFVEGRRLGVKYLYLYVVSGVVVAIGVAFPLFMAAREIIIAKNYIQEERTVKYYDVFALAILFLMAISSGFAVL